MTENKTFLVPTAGLVAPFQTQPESVTLMVSPCRSGSTVMLRVFGYAGVTSYFQPIKNALRWRYLGQDRPWVAQVDKELFLKETFGPYHRFEVGFDPIEHLLAAGLKPDRLRLLVLMRDPASVWASWQAVWPGLTQIGMLQAAFAATEATYRNAITQGIATRLIEFEACVADPRTQLGELFAWLGRDLPQQALAGWDQQAPFAEKGSGVIMAQEPERYAAPDAHAPTLASRAFGDIPHRSHVTQADRAAIAATEIGQITNQIKSNDKARVA